MAERISNDLSVVIIVASTVLLPLLAVISVWNFSALSFPRF
jgi:hypothetical protein